MRNHRTSMGTPNSVIGKSAALRIVECRPSHATTRSAVISFGPSGVCTTTPVILPLPRSRSVASYSIRRSKLSNCCACSERKFRKSHCGISATNLQWVGTRLKSATLKRKPPTTPEMDLSFWCGRCRNSSRSSSSYINSNVDGWTVSPRKSRKKSLCFSRTVTRTPLRASR